MEQNNDLKDYIKDIITGVNARIDSTSELTNLKIEKIDSQINNNADLTNLKLEQINKHLEKQNGRISKSEEVISTFLIDRAKDEQRSEDEEENRVYNCPQLPRLSKIEKESITKTQLYTGLIIASIVITILVNVSKLMF